MKMITYLYIAFLAISIILIYYAFVGYNETRNLIANGYEAEAVVVSLITVRSSDGDGDTYKPVFEYTDRKNNVKTFRSSVSSRPASYNIGEKVAVIYSKDGNDNRIKSFWGLYRTVIILSILAFPLLIIGGGYLLYITT